MRIILMSVFFTVRLKITSPFVHCPAGPAKPLVRMWRFAGSGAARSAPARARRKLDAAVSEPEITASDQPLIDHRVGDSDERRDIGARDVVSRLPVVRRGLEARVVGPIHEVSQTAVDLFSTPRLM